MLLSGTGLIGLLVFNLWNAVAMTESRAVLEAQHQADFTAAIMRDLLRAERFLEMLPERSRFAVHGGTLVVPAEVRWLTPPTFPKYENLDVLVQDKLEQAGSPVADEPDARQLLQTLLSDSGTRNTDHDWLAARAAWHAHRTRQIVWRDSLMRELEGLEGGAAPAATLLLHVAVHRRLPAWAKERIASLPEGLARPLLGRLREKGLEVEHIAQQLTQTMAQRAAMKTVEQHLPAFRHEQSPFLRPAGERLLLFHGDATADGHGALLSRSKLIDILTGIEDTPWPATSPDSLTADADEGSITVVPDYLFLRPRAVPTTGMDGTSVLGLMVLALALLSGTGLWMLYRSMRKEAEAARTRSEFLTMVTHELKTPLAGIRLLAEMLQEGHVQEGTQQQDYYVRLTSESVRLSMLIENVLDLGRMERGERAYDMRPVDTRELVSEAVELFEPIGRRAGLRVEMTAGGDARPGLVSGDRNALLQSLLNVMDNGRKYAAQGGRLEVGVLVAGDQCRITVRDHGPGIAEEERAAIFERFQRGARHRHGSVPGVGLGLYLARTILRSHGGNLEAIAVEDGGPGACFLFSLPICTAEVARDVLQKEATAR